MYVDAGILKSIYHALFASHIHYGDRMCAQSIDFLYFKRSIEACLQNRVSRDCHIIFLFQKLRTSS